MCTLKRRQGERKAAGCKGKVCVNQCIAAAEGGAAIGLSFSFYVAPVAISSEVQRSSLSTQLLLLLLLLNTVRILHSAMV